MYAGADWIKRALCVTEMSQLGQTVADLLGDLFYGIYHMNTTSLRKTDWSDPYCVTVTSDYNLATFDSDGLTRLVVLCHDRAIRCNIRALAPGYMQLMFHQRKREGRHHERHPTLEDSTARIRQHYAPDH